MARIKWNKRAGRQFSELQNYLLQEFGETTVKNFTSHTFKFLDLLVKHPHLGTVENKEKGIRGFVLHRHTTVLYKENKGAIYILSLYDNRKKPKSNN